MNQPLWVYLAGVVLVVVAYLSVKWFSRGRVVLSFGAAEGILIATITIACFAAAFVSGQFQ